MDPECCSLLPRVCEVLAASGGSLPDDTSLEKLLDWFTALTEAGESLLEDCPCLHEFISTVVHNKTAEPGVLSFVVKLTGLIAATEDGFKTFQESSVLDQAFNSQRWREAELWEHPCVRIGWIQGLRTMLQHPKALDFFLRAEFIEPLLQLQTDSSLFVASAANQMLAQVLLLCQPARPADCNGSDKTEVDAAAWRTSAAALESPAATRQGFPDEAVEIMQYLQKSLVPSQKTQLHQSLQTLKLLASLLTRTGPPLRDALLRTVAASLEELVAAEHSRLTLPLMDVIVAAYSSSSCDDGVLRRHVTRLLSAMLSAKKPADLTHAAAAFLRRAPHDPVHTAQCVNVLLLPLDIMTGQSLLCTSPAVDALRCPLKEQLRNKPSCTSIICVCLTNAPQITLVDPDSLPCLPAAVVTAVLSLLKLCGGDSCSSSDCSEFLRNIVGSRKVQRCALEALTGLSGSPGVKVKLLEVFTLLVQYLDSPDSDPTVLHKSYQALVKWIHVCTDVSSITEQLRQDLLQVVKKRACDMRWEVRDSTLEFLGYLVGVSVGHSEQPRSASDALLGGCGSTTPLLREALQDPESYVRASATSALAQTLTPGWQQGAALTQEQTELVSRLLEILSKDTEGFARRAVVRYFIAWFSSHSSHSPSPSPSSSSSCCSSLLMQSVRSVLSRGSEDLDWEVKVHTLQLAELLLADAFPGRWGRAEASDSGSSQPHPYAVTSNQAHALHTHTGTHTEGVEPDSGGALGCLVELGVFSVLLSGLVDCDRPVGLKACRLLITLRETVCPSSQGPPNPAAAMATLKLPAHGWAGEIRKMLVKENRADTVSRGSPDETDAAGPADRGEAAAAAAGREEEASVRVSACEVLRSLSLDEKLAVLTRSSDHVHNSPLSLLQDILTASAAHKLPDTEAGPEVIVDCY